MPPVGLSERLGSNPDRQQTGLTMTARQFETWAPGSGERVEWVEGRVIVMAPASRKHVQLTGWIQSLLLIIVQQHKLGEVLGPEFMVRLHKGERSWRVPDVLFVSETRRSLLTATFLDGPPDVAIEVVSTDSVARDWREKYIAYETSGVREYWIIDPLSKTLEAYGLKRKKFHLISADSDGSVHSQVIASFGIRPSWLWGDSLPPVLDVLRELGVV